MKPTALGVPSWSIHRPRTALPKTPKPSENTSAQPLTELLENGVLPVNPAHANDRDSASLAYHALATLAHTEWPTKFKVLAADMRDQSAQHMAALLEYADPEHVFQLLNKTLQRNATLGDAESHTALQQVHSDWFVGALNKAVRHQRIPKPAAVLSQLTQLSGLLDRLDATAPEPSYKFGELLDSLNRGLGDLLTQLSLASEPVAIPGIAPAVLLAQLAEIEKKLAPHAEHFGGAVLKQALSELVGKTQHVIGYFKQQQAQQRLLELGEKSRTLYVEPGVMDKCLEFHKIAGELLNSPDLQAADQEQLDGLLIRYALAPNLPRETRNQCVAALFDQRPEQFQARLERWTERCMLPASAALPSWPRKPQIAAWLEHVVNSGHQPLSPATEKAVRQAVKMHAPLYPTKVNAGAWGLVPGHEWQSLFPGDHEPALLQVANIESAEQGVKDPAQAASVKLTFKFPQDPELARSFTAGQHFALMDLRACSPEFRTSLNRIGRAALAQPQFAAEAEALKKATFRLYTIASPSGGNSDGSLNITVRVQKDDPKSTSNFIAALRSGDACLAGFPMTDFTRCPKPQTPTILFGQGTSASLAHTFQATRGREKTEFAPSYMVMNYKSNALRFWHQALKKEARKPENNTTYRALVSETDRLRPNIQKAENANDVRQYARTLGRHLLSAPARARGADLVKNLMDQRQEAERFQALVLNPDTHFYFSGILGTAENTMAAMTASAVRLDLPNGNSEQLERAVETAKREGRFHVEGSVARGAQSRFQGV